MLAYLVLQLLFAAEPGRRKTQCASVPYHCGQRLAVLFHTLFPRPSSWTQFVGGAAPCVQRSGGLQPPAPPPLPTPVLLAPLVCLLNTILTIIPSDAAAVALPSPTNMLYQAQRRPIFTGRRRHLRYQKACTVPILSITRLTGIGSNVQVKRKYKTNDQGNRQLSSCG